jgi:HD-GYP domain-containing protein (c-di-GMP phosphodiesterase class II)
VRHHHERYDGRGYPDGLAGEEIPLEARIILVADAFEAMTSDRPYRKAPGQSFALQELHSNAGTQFDPHVVDALARVLERGDGAAWADAAAGAIV